LAREGNAAVPESDDGDAVFMAFVYGVLGREAETFEWLERSYEAREH
jgi:hypothetical protein